MCSSRSFKSKANLEESSLLLGTPLPVPVIVVLLHCCSTVDRERRGSGRTRLLAQRVPQECTVVNGAIRQRRCVGLPVLPVIEGGRGAPYHRALCGGGSGQHTTPHSLSFSLARSSHASHLPTYYLYLLLCVQISIFYNEAEI